MVEIGRLGYSAYRMGNTVATVIDILDFDDEDAKEWENKLVKIREEKLRPVVNSLNYQIDRVYDITENLEETVVDKTVEKLKSLTDIEGTIK